MRCRTFRLFSLFLLAGLLAGARGQEVLDGIAAVVNEQVITFSQVRDLVGPKEKAIREALKGEALVEQIKQIRLAAVNELINRQLILQEFEKMKKKGANIPPHVIEEHVETIIREQFNGDRSAFLRTLAAQGYSIDRFRQLEEEKIIVQAMRGQQVKASTIVPEAKIREFYQEHIADYTSAEELKLRMLVMKKGEDAKLTQMEEIRKKIIAGAEFADMARIYDESASQEQGGDWGWINRKTLNETLTKVAFSLKPGEISKILDLSGNYYLLFCEAKKNANTRGFNELRDDIEKRLVQEERQKAQEEWLAKLRKTAYIKIF